MPISFDFVGGLAAVLAAVAAMDRLAMSVNLHRPGEARGHLVDLGVEQDADIVADNSLYFEAALQQCDPLEARLGKGAQPRDFGFPLRIGGC